MDQAKELQDRAARARYGMMDACDGLSNLHSNALERLELSREECKYRGGKIDKLTDLLEEQRTINAEKSEIMAALEKGNEDRDRQIDELKDLLDEQVKINEDLTYKLSAARVEAKMAYNEARHRTE